MAIKCKSKEWLDCICSQNSVSGYGDITLCSLKPGFACHLCKKQGSYSFSCPECAFFPQDIKLPFTHLFYVKTVLYYVFCCQYIMNDNCKFQ